MATTIIKGGTLGEKHQAYNKQLNEVLMIEDTKELKDINFDDLDINNLLQIDIACHNKHVEYILKVLKSNDMLYVSRAIRKSVWLITENQYENIINPDYLQNKLFPEMITKACIKLKKSIMHNLSDQSRREYFYEKEKCDKTAIKWLLGCSLPFIEKNIEKHCKHLNPVLIKRFCEKSVPVFKILSKSCSNQSLLTSAAFLIYTHVDVYLDVLESSSNYEYPQFNARATESVMKYASERIINNFHIYADIVNIKAFARFIPKENIKSFLYTLAHKGLHDSRYNYMNFFHSDKILYIIRQMPKDEQYKFVKKVFIDEIDINEESKPLPLSSELQEMKELRDRVRLEQYIWYQFAPFDVAFEEIKNRILEDSSSFSREALLKTLIYATNNNMQNIETFLNYYKNNHKNDDNYTKRNVINSLLDYVNVYNFDKKTWAILTEIYRSMDVFEESSVDDQNYIVSIILYHVVRRENVPEIIEKKFVFDTFKSHCKLINKAEKEKVFIYLRNYLLQKINAHIISNESDLKDAVELIKSYLHLLSDWEKQLLDHPLILNKIRELIETRQKNTWKIDFSSLYNVKKSWRKHMFEESLSLCPSEKVCINALKHDPSLLNRYNSEIKHIRTNDEVSLQHLLGKLRIFWSQSLATEWANIYSEHLNILGNHKAIIRGLCGLLKKNQLLNIIKAYAPKEEKINWSEIDDLTLSLQRQIAKNMHCARPQPDADAILLYAKGDYLNYALPSLLAIFYNMNLINSRETFMKLLDARVSLQKHVIRFAFLKLDRGEMKEIFFTIWKGTKNATIRCIIFNYTFNILCDNKEDASIKCYAELLEMFIDNLTSEEDKKIYEQFKKIREVSITVRANILMKAYKLFQRLLHVSNKDTNIKTQFKYIINSLVDHTRDIMELIPSEFATEMVNNYINEYFFTHDEYMRAGKGVVNVISAYILSSKDIETQTERYETTLKPLIKRCLNLWNEKQKEGNYFIRKKLQCLLSTLRMDLKMYMKKINFKITNNLFSNIQLELKSLDVSENYVMLTTWELTTEMTKLLRNVDTNSDWNETCSKCATDFGKNCLQYLRTNVETYFSCIYVLFAKALIEVTSYLFDDGEKFKIYKSMLYDKEFMQAYLCVITLFPLPHNINKELKSEANTILKTISTHPSVEVKMHYYNRFSKFNDDL